MQGRLYTRKRLFDWGRADSENCVLCDSEAETEQHLWFGCGYTKAVAEIVLNWARVGCIKETVKEWLDWFVDSPGKHSLIFETKLLALNAIVYFIWKARNLKIHE